MDDDRWPSVEFPSMPAALRARFAVVDLAIKVGHPELIVKAKTWEDLEQAWTDFEARPKVMTGTWATRILLVLDRLMVKRWSTVAEIQADTGLRTRHVRGALSWLHGRGAVQARGNPKEYRIR